MKISIKAKTDGGGYWSLHIAEVHIIRLECNIFDEDDDELLFGELLAYFDDSWSSHDHGLIYTDKNWMIEFKEGLMQHGFTHEAINDIDYSEQGMQGIDYVSMDVGEIFIKEWRQTNT